MPIPDPASNEAAPSLLRAVDALIQREVGDGAATSHEIAAGAARACDKICSHLSQILGKAGIAALFQRSLALTRQKFPWFAPPPGDARSSHLHAALDGQPPDLALEASAMVILALVDLIGRFIGPDLTLRLLEEVWPEVSSRGTPKETT